ncbi:1-deoxy-D-xylulose 5-phosphate reductoisomerase [Desulfobotulus alkaliphilus]|uniref:1-deoxy-D-xylulose 5-phosphate reductoisomerase n=1 Tax=Desulfobotulus alkaliphilus TaxID=622671 RepID=A0A562S8A9_9BACT|nr:1-deoxy-D-xylulose-5-phosphate reductoisomerase [Desulfobotulus alkaliphilus]TWI77423.1 1-deoxy-D-xylulose 5-phosphate reductoisomerase [Desulfobotulus alkaliphilus]
MKNLCILGCTGSIGRNVVEIVRRFPDRYRALVLAAGDNVDLLSEQMALLKPRVVVLRTEAGALALQRSGAAHGVEVLYGDAGYIAAATHTEVDTVVAAIVGAAGLLPTMAAVDAGKTLALANKESLVVAGGLLMPLARERGVDILPVDSEHSAVFQCLAGQRGGDVAKLLLTASGGPFRTRHKSSFDDIRPEDALAHPTWNMGRKISIDSATLMNKGLEVIEAMHLFSVPVEKIDVVVHPQSIVHSMVAFCDGTVMAQMGIPDMKGAIALALSWPERLPLNLPLPDFSALDMRMEAPDLERFPCLGLAFDAAREGGVFPAVLNAANEVAVEAFLQGRIPFPRISGLIAETLMATENHRVKDLEDLLQADANARQTALSLIRSV